MKVVGMMYGRCMEANRGKAPVDQDEFVAFLETEPDNWNKLAGTPKALLTSPRDDEPLVIVYGDAVIEPSEGGFPWVAHEKTGAGGTLMAVNARGSVERKSAAEIGQLFPK